MPDRYVRDGTKKILSLAKTKIRLAKEADTIECIPAPLPLVKLLSGTDINTIAEADSFRERLLEEIDLSDEESIASTVLQCMDMIEGVKHRYEPKEYRFSLPKEKLREIEEEAKEKNVAVNIMLMTENTGNDSINLYFGEKPAPKDAVYASGVPTSIASFLSFAFKSDHFSSCGRLKNITTSIGRLTLINNAICFALGFYGSDLLSCDKYLDCDGIHEPRRSI